MLIGLGWNDLLFGKKWHLHHTGRNWQPSSPSIQAFFFVSQHVFVIFFTWIRQHFLLCYFYESYLFLLISKLHQARMVWNNVLQFQHHIVKDTLSLQTLTERLIISQINERMNSRWMTNGFNSPDMEELSWLDYTAGSWWVYHDQYSHQIRFSMDTNVQIIWANTKKHDYWIVC